MINRIKKQNGFSLMELIAVMAVMAILAGALAPNIFEQIKRAKADAEIINLKMIMNDFIIYTQDEKIIPNSSVDSWTQAVASVSSRSTKRIEYNEYNYRRRLVFDPRFLSNEDSNFSGIIQDQGLATEPVSPRVMLISDLTSNVSNIENTSTVFNDIWQQNNSATLKESSDLKIERWNLKNNFHRLILTNANINEASYQLEGGSVIAVPASRNGADGIITRWVINKTKISLYNIPGQANKAVDSKTTENEKDHGMGGGMGDDGMGMGGMGDDGMGMGGMGDDGMGMGGMGGSGGGGGENAESEIEITNIIENDWSFRYQSNGTVWYWGKP